MSGPEIAAEVAAALAEAGEAVGTGPLICTIRREGVGGPQTPSEVGVVPDAADVLFPVTGIKAETTSRYMDGTLIGELRRVVTVDATGVRPVKSDKVAVGIAPSDVTGNTVFEEIIEIETEEPADVPLMHGIHLAI